jgi:hypothetical protein
MSASVCRRGRGADGEELLRTNSRSTPNGRGEYPIEGLRRAAPRRRLCVIESHGIADILDDVQQQ